MQRARSEAVSRNVSAAFILGNGVFWTVRDISTNQTIETRPAGEISQYVSMNISPAPPPGFAIPTTTITFNSLGAVIANADGSPSITQIDIDSTALSAADSRELRITVGIGGIIRMCDPNPSIATTDPRHC